MASQFIENVTAGVVANLLYTLLVAAIVLFGVFYFVERERKKLFRLLGINPNDARLRIYLSRLDVLKSGSRGTDGPLPVGFVGPALMRLEYNGALALRDVACADLLRRVPRVLSGMLKARSPWLKDVRVDIDVAPDADGTEAAVFASEDAVVLLGSDVYSQGVRRIFANERSFFFFCQDRPGAAHTFNAARHQCEPTFAVRLPGRVEVLPGRSSSREVAIIQRVSLNPGGKQIIVCAGISSSSTSAAAQYLAARWDDLVTRFGSDDFGICFAMPHQRPDHPTLVALEELPYTQRRRRVD